MLYQVFLRPKSKPAARILERVSSLGIRSKKTGLPPTLENLKGFLRLRRCYPLLSINATEEHLPSGTALLMPFLVGAIYEPIL